jgi:hypothetical protein
MLICIICLRFTMKRLKKSFSRNLQIPIVKSIEASTDNDFAYSEVG